MATPCHLLKPALLGQPALTKSTFTGLSVLSRNRAPASYRQHRAKCISASVTEQGTQKVRLLRQIGTEGLDQPADPEQLQSPSGGPQTTQPPLTLPPKDGPKLRQILQARAQVDWEVIKSLTEHIAQGINQTTLSGLQWWFEKLVERGGTIRDVERLIKYQNRSGYTLLHCAADKDGRPSLIPLLAQLGAELGSRDSQGWTALHYAASSGQSEAVKALLAAGAEVDSRNEAGESSLMLAVAQQDLKSAEALLKHGAEASGLLNEAVNSRSLKQVRCLLEHGVNPNTASCFFQKEDGSREQTTALHIAAYTGEENIIATLLEFGAQVTEVDSEGATPLLVAVRQGNLSVVRRLLQAGSDPEAQTSQGSSATLAAYHSGSLDMLELLLKEGKANPVCQCGENTMLGHAVANNKLPRARLLLKYGADPNGPAVWITRRLISPEGSPKVWGNGALEQTTLLHVATLEGNAKMVAALVDAGADMGERALDRTTPLIYAVTRNHISVAKELLRRGCDVEQVDGYCNTAAVIATRRSQSAMLQVLLRYGAHAGARLGGLGGGPTLLQIAVGKLDVSMVRALLKHGAEPNTAGRNTNPPLRRALIAMDQATEMLAASSGQFLKHGADEDLVLRAVFDNNHCRFREQAEVPVVPKVEAKIQKVVTNAVEIVKLLIASGGDLFDRDNQGYTLVHNAVCLRRDTNAEMLKVLLDNGAPGVTAFDKSMRTPLHLAAGDRNIEACKLLLQNGASLSTREAAGMSPLDFAASVGHTHIVEYFRNTPLGWHK